MMANERYPLRQIILDDLTSHNKVALILLLCVVISAVMTVWVTHQTRLLTAQESYYASQNEKLNDQYINLQLEENSRSKKSIIEAAAEKLELRAIKKDQEVILMR
ncbi:MAG: cell division protein FtsL [Pasteurellaceae bacterium]|nr:cell division protein FtsL [Pasteurellaceae bacterium]